jgi:hypothetical protein
MPSSLPLAIAKNRWETGEAQRGIVGTYVLTAIPS